MVLTPLFIGRCLCGAVTYRCTESPLWQAHCHCDSCSRATASPMTSVFGMADGAFDWTGLPPAADRPSPGTLREIGSACGTRMAFHTGHIPGEHHFYAATLDDPAAFTPTEHDHTNEQLPWLHLADSLARR